MARPAADRRREQRGASRGRRRPAFRWTLPQRDEAARGVSVRLRAPRAAPPIQQNPGTGDCPSPALSARVAIIIAGRGLGSTLGRHSQPRRGGPRVATWPWPSRVEGRWARSGTTAVCMTSRPIDFASSTISARRASAPRGRWPAGFSQGRTTAVRVAPLAVSNCGVDWEEMEKVSSAVMGRSTWPGVMRAVEGRAYRRAKQKSRRRHEPRAPRTLDQRRRSGSHQAIPLLTTDPPQSRSLTSPAGSLLVQAGGSGGRTRRQLFARAFPFRSPVAAKCHQHCDAGRPKVLCERVKRR